MQDVPHICGQQECNDYSIGIELEGSDDCAFETLQYQVLAQVVVSLQQAYPAIQQHVAGHSDIAPGRKTDPEPLLWLGEVQKLGTTDKRTQNKETFPLRLII